MSAPSTQPEINIKVKKKNKLQHIMQYKELYLLLLPVIIFYLLFAYKPMYGVLIAFKDFNFKLGITGSKWVGLKHFREMFVLPGFMNALKNSLIIALGRIVIEFPLPIILAIILSEVKNRKTQKFFQTVYTFPHFLSWVIISGIALNFFGDAGVVNGVLSTMGMEKVNILSNPNSFLAYIFGTSIWKEMGWGTIIFLATMAGISPELYEAADIDGANRWQKIKTITLPLLMPTMIILLTLKIGQAMSLGGFDQILNIYNPAVYDVADILDTYVYRRTFALGASFSSSAAVGLFKSGINFVLLAVTHVITKKMGQEGIM